MLKSRNFLLVTSVLFLLYGTYTVLATSQILSELGDEAFYRRHGLVYWTTKVFADGHDHPPLCQLMASFFKYFGGFDDLFHARLPFGILYFLSGITLTTLCFLNWGPLGSFLISFFFATCPTTKAMASLVTVDFPPAVFSALAALFIFSAWNTRHKVPAVFLAGLCFSLAICSKISCLWLAPFLGYFLLIKLDRKLIIHFAAGTLLGFMISYLFQISEMRHYWDSLVFQSNHNKGGHLSYIFGTQYRKGIWYYYLALLPFKSPIVFLGFYILAIYETLKNPRNFKLQFWAFLAPALLLLLILSVLRVQLGFRYFLPGLFLLHIYFASVISKLKNPIITNGLIVIAVAMIPKDYLTLKNDLYLSYFNSLAPSPTRAFADSNIDWGQNIPDHIQKQFPDYSSFIGFSDLLNSQQNQFKIYTSASPLGGLWGPGLTPLLRSFPIGQNQGGFEFFDLTKAEVFTLLIQKTWSGPYTNDLMKVASEPYQSQNCTEFTATPLQANIEFKLSDTTKRVFILFEKDEDIILKTRKQDRGLRGPLILSFHDEEFYLSNRDVSIITAHCP